MFEVQKWFQVLQAKSIIETSFTLSFKFQVKNQQLLSCFMVQNFASVCYAPLQREAKVSTQKKCHF